MYSVPVASSFDGIGIILCDHRNGVKDDVAPSSESKSKRDEYLCVCDEESETVQEHYKNPPFPPSMPLNWRGIASFVNFFPWSSYTHEYHKLVPRRDFYIQLGLSFVGGVLALWLITSSNAAGHLHTTGFSGN